MGIYTRGGDAGQTALLGGARVAKDSLRIEVYGTLDEATSALGLARATTAHDDICRQIIALQGELIGVMGELASPTPDAALRQHLAPQQVRPEQVTRLEGLIDGYEAERTPSSQFVRPGGSPAAAAIDMARTFVRRAERRLVGLAREEPLNPELLRYLNRLSDLLYVMARVDEERTITAAVRRQLQAAALDPSQGGAMRLSLADCDRMIEAGIRHAATIGVPMVLVVADAAGQLVELRRMDGALLVSVDLAPRKAHTAAAVRMPTSELARLAQPAAPLFGIAANMPGLTLVGGGLPLLRGGAVVGAVGVSGGAVEQDVAVAEAMAAALA